MQTIILIIALFFIPLKAEALNTGAGDLEEAILQLTKTGVDVHFETCDSDVDYNGYYDTYHNYMIICRSSNVDRMRRTFQHETIHVLQDCKAGLANEDYLPLLTAQTIRDMSSKEVKQFVANYYDESVWHVELEANSYDTNEWTFSKMSLTAAIKHYC